uniref:phosphoribosylanthranilate isomerase n=1 Tax=Klebsiella pneumoniae TaxID=573 RepID=UPI001E3AFCF7|nr:hypothetical protein [Klebsiella pneumoniae]
MPAKIKICGISTPEALDATIAARADYAGLVFYPASPRAVTSNVAGALTSRAAGQIAMVGLFVDADDAVIASERKPLILYITTVSAEDTHVAGKERHGESIAHSNKRLRTPPTRPDAALPAG